SSLTKDKNMYPPPYNNKDKICPPPKDILNRPFIKCALARYTPSIIMHAPILSINYTLGGHYRVSEKLNKLLFAHPPINSQTYGNIPLNRMTELVDEAFYLAGKEKKKSMPRFPYSVEPYSL